MIEEPNAVAVIKAMTPDSTKFLNRKRGFVDYKFSELARYKGYEAACTYAESVLRWHDADKFAEAILLTSYAAFKEAEQKQLVYE